MHYYAYALQRIFQIVDRTPRIVLMIASGAVASLVMRLLHKPPPEGAPGPQQAQPAVPEKAAAESVASSTAVASSSSPSKSKGKSRKGAKK